MKIYHPCVYLPLIARTRAPEQEWAWYQTPVIPFRWILYSEMTELLKNVTTKKDIVNSIVIYLCLVSGHILLCFLKKINQAFMHHVNTVTIALHTTFISNM